MRNTLFRTTIIAPRGAAKASAIRLRPLIGDDSKSQVGAPSSVAFVTLVQKRGIRLDCIYGR